MSTESKPERRSAQTWGEFNNMQGGNEKDGWGLDWFEAGHIGEVALDDENSRQALHRYLDSFNKAFFDTDDRPFQFVVAPAVLNRLVKDPDINKLNVQIEPYSDRITLDQLKEFTDKVKGR